MREPNNAIALVQTFHDALAASDPDRLAALAGEEIALAGPRGVEFGRESLRAWARESGIRLTPRRWFHAEQVIVEQEARWRDEASGAWGEPVTVATSFAIRDGQIIGIERFDEIEPVLAAAGLTGADEIQVIRDQSEHPHGSQTV